MGKVKRLVCVDSLPIGPSQPASASPPSSQSASQPAGDIHVKYVIVESSSKYRPLPPPSRASLTLCEFVNPHPVTVQFALAP